MAVAAVGSDQEPLKAALAGLEEIARLRRGLAEGLASLEQVQSSVHSAVLALSSQQGAAAASAEADDVADEAHVEVSLGGGHADVDGELCGIDEVAFALPAGWPATLQLHEQLAEDVKKLQANKMTTSMHHAVSKQQSQRGKTLLDVSGHEERRPYVMNPHSKLRGLLDLTSMVVLVYDLWVIPVVLAFEIEMRGPVLWLACFTLAFWTLDLLATFRTAVYVKGNLETNPRGIARQYLRTWFTVDLVVLLSDWVSTSLVLAQVAGYSSDGEGIRMLRIAKIGRALRLAGVVKLRRFSQVLERLLEKHLPVGMETVMNVLKLFFFIIWTNHIVSCIWFAIGSLVDPKDTDTGLRWLDTNVGSSSDATYADYKFYSYFTAYHWSLCQMTPGSLQVNPLNTTERAFNIVCLLLGMIFFSSLVSSVSAKLTEFRIRQEKKTVQARNLRRYLLQCNVSNKTAIAVQRQLAERMQQQAPLVAKDVVALDMLSQQMQAKISHEYFAPYLSRSPLWRWWIEVDPSGFEMFCHQAMETRILAQGDIVFRTGDIAKGAHTVVSGTLTYTLEVPLVKSIVTEVEDVEKGAWLSEAALWIRWPHVGSAEVQTNSCELITISTKRLLESSHRSRLVSEIFADYARAYHGQVVNAKPPATSWPTDLAVPDTKFADVLPHMSLHSRQIIGSVAVSVIRGSGFRSLLISSRALNQLVEEVSTGRCMLMIDGAGEVERLINVVTLRVVSDDGRLFAQIGKWDQGKAHAACQLPGTKQRPGESTLDAVERLLSKELAPLAPFIRLGEKDVETESKMSRSIGARTMYKRTVHHAKLDGPLDALRLVVAKPRHSEKPRVSSHSEKPRFSGRSEGMILSSTATDASCDEGVQDDVETYVLSDGGGTVNLYAWMMPRTFARCHNKERLLQPRLGAIRVLADDISEAGALREAAALPRFKSI